MRIARHSSPVTTSILLYESIQFSLGFTLHKQLQPQCRTDFFRLTTQHGGFHVSTRVNCLRRCDIGQDAHVIYHLLFSFIRPFISLVSTHTFQDNNMMVSILHCQLFRERKKQKWTPNKERRQTQNQDVAKQSQEVSYNLIFPRQSTT